VLGVRFADRFGKGVRSAPRDVMIAESTEPFERGRAFGLHRTMDTLGAAVGPLLVILLAWLVLRHTNVADLGADRAIYTWIFLGATIPAVLGWLVLALFVPEKTQVSEKAQRPVLSLKAFDTRFKMFLLAVTIFAVGNSSDAFLVIRATSKDSIGMSFVSFLWVYVAFNLLQAAVTYRSGILSDRIGRRPLIVVGWLIFAGCYFAIARIASPTGVWVTFLIYGAYYGMTEGVLRAYAVDLAPPHMKGTAVGLFHTFNGLALLPASIVAGKLWDAIGPGAPFYYGSITAIIAVIVMALFVKESVPSSTERSQ
jgi:MFS family permease